MVSPIGWHIFWTALAALLIDRTVATRYKPNWKSLDARPLPSWYNDNKLGVFAHWGVYAVPAFHSEWFWYYWRQPGSDARRYDEFVVNHFRNGTTYAEFATQFTVEDFNADQFAKVIKSSGAKYFVLTSKHHEGFTLWPSATAWNWNAVEVGAHQDLVGALAHSIRAAGLRFGTYFSLMDWFHPLYLADKTINRTDYVETVALPQLHELIDRYQPDVIWSDGDWEVSDKYWRSEKFLAWLYNESPIKDVVVVNDRWGSGTVGKHGGFLTHSDQFDPGVLMPRKWENCLKLDANSWGYRRDIQVDDVLSAKTLVITLARTIACGGNLLLNIGPDRTGRIAPIFEERLRQLGAFVRVNEEAIFDTLPWIHQNESNRIWYTSRLRREGNEPAKRIFNPQTRDNTVIYAFVVEIPQDGIVEMPSVIPIKKTVVTLLGTSHHLQIKPGRFLAVNVSQISWHEWQSQAAIVLKIEYAATKMHNPLATAHRRRTVTTNGMMGQSAKALRSNSPHARPVTVVGRGELPNETLLLETESTLVMDDQPRLMLDDGPKLELDNKTLKFDESEELKMERNHLIASNFNGWWYIWSDAECGPKRKCGGMIAKFFVRVLKTNTALSPEVISCATINGFYHKLSTIDVESLNPNHIGRPSRLH